LSSLGGVIGVFAGIGLAAAAVEILTMVTMQPWHLTIDVASVIGALIFALLVGVFFGFYPAWRASRLDPIAALRRE
jgi:putative ABC transport system permease protein